MVGTPMWEVNWCPKLMFKISHLSLVQVKHRIMYLLGNIELNFYNILDSNKFVNQNQLNFS